MKINEGEKMENKPRAKLKELKFIKTIKRNLKAGFVPAVLIILGILIIKLIIQALNGIISPLYRLFDQYIPGSKIEPLNIIYLTIFSLTITFLLFIGFGAIIMTIKTKSRGFMKSVAALVLKLPFAKKIIMPEETLENNEGFSESSDQTQGLVIRFKSVFGLDVLGFAMKQIKTFDCQQKKWIDEFAVLVPNSPLPWSGYLHFVPVNEAKIIGIVTLEKNRYQIIKMSRAECIKIIVSGGLSAPSFLTLSDVNFPLEEVQKILSEHEKKYPRKKRQTSNNKNAKEHK